MGRITTQREFSDDRRVKLSSLRNGDLFVHTADPLRTVLPLMKIQSAPEWGEKESDILTISLDHGDVFWCAHDTLVYEVEADVVVWKVKM